MDHENIHNRLKGFGTDAIVAWWKELSQAGRTRPGVWVFGCTNIGGKFNKIILFLLLGGLYIGVLMFLFDWFQVDWTFPIAGGEYGMAARKSRTFLYFGSWRWRVNFLGDVALAMIAVGVVLGLYRSWRMRCIEARP